MTELQHDASSHSKEDAGGPADAPTTKESAFKNLGWLDRLLAL